MRAIRLLLAAAAIAAAPGLAWAHPGHPAPADFASGVMHPLGGLDHLLAMAAVGLMAARAGGRALVVVPAAFAGGMLVGLAGGLWTPAAGFVEMAVAGSVLLLGLAVVAERTLPWRAMAGAAALVGLAHGYVHGAESPGTGDVAAWAAGILAATLGIHAAGALIGSSLIRSQMAWARRAGGGAMAAYGAVLVTAVT